MRPTLLSTARRPEPSPLAPDRALVVGGRSFAAPLNQGAVGIKEKLGVVEGSTVTLVDADGHNNCQICRPRHLRNRVRQTNNGIADLSIF
jgi:hypothetical protein